LAWQLLQASAAVGMCGGVVNPCAPDVPWLAYEPLWHVAHGVAATAVWFIV